MARFPIYHHETGVQIGTAEIPDDIIYAAGKVEAWIRAHEYPSTEIVLNGLVIKKGWKPIETAPKDGTKILIYTDLDDVDSACFLPNSGWFNGEIILEDMDVVVTHWMPLPEPPNV